nr:MAG TPA: hypothetical protein [Caudoviricetes sp.]DAW71480.1 MAG TPA: hypothetical protein [Caudoviricetes sp.]
MPEHLQVREKPEKLGNLLMPDRTKNVTLY